MHSFTFLCVLLIAAALVFAFKQNQKFKNELPNKVAGRPLVAKGFGIMLMLAQASELIKLVEHASVLSVIVAILLLAVWHASKGNEGDLH